MSIESHGTHDQEPDSVCYISYWHIPGGWDYVNAEIRTLFFPVKEYAETVAAKYDPPPEMAVVIDLSVTPALAAQTI